MHNEKTVQQAKKLMLYFLNENTKRKNHTLRVVENLKELLVEKGLQDTEVYYLLLEAGYLHDIGYSSKLNKENFHPYDGFIYLQEQNYSDAVNYLVLHHTYSKLLYNMSNKNTVLDIIYQKNPIQSNYETLLSCLSLADMTSSPTGEKITLNERVEDIAFRYGNDSPITKHAYIVKSKLENM